VYRFPSYLTARHQQLRDHVREWIGSHPNPTPAEFARGGLVAPGWPRPWGLDAGVGGQLVVRQELGDAGLTAPVSEIAVNWTGPALLQFGSAQQRDRYLWPMLEGTEKWCRLHSEPDAGSDLTMVGTRADRTTEGFRINGQKIWTFHADTAHYGAVLARTSGSRGDPDGISYFILPMNSPGLTVVPIKDLTGGSTVSEVFFDDVELPADHLIGALGAGLRMRRPNVPAPTVSFNAGFGAGHDPALLKLLQPAGWADIPSTVADRLLDLYIESQSIDALAILDSEEEWNADRLSPQRGDVRRWLTQEFRRAVIELIHDLRSEAESFDRGSVLDRLGQLGIAASILRAAIATVPNGGSDIHLETITARLLYPESPVLTAWAGEQ
jgi:Acyl-CoA dehydrogenase, middle domain/Acyl-CoA dehydrogenase, N-terminal domain